MILAIYGAGKLGEEVYELAKLINTENKIFDKAVFIDDINPGGFLCDLRVMTFDEAIGQYSKDELRFVVAVGEPSIRKVLFEKVEDKGYEFQTLINPLTRIPDNVKTGRGVVIVGMSHISCNVILNDNCYLQPFCAIGHNGVIGSHSVISAHVSTGGCINLGECCYVGLSSAIKEEITIGDNTIIGMGSVVYRDVESGVTALGNPARVMKKNEDNRVFRR